jgi:hypothetical protein
MDFDRSDSQNRQSAKAGRASGLPERSLCSAPRFAAQHILPRKTKLRLSALFRLPRQNIHSVSGADSYGRRAAHRKCADRVIYFLRALQRKKNCSVRKLPLIQNTDSIFLFRKIYAA